MQSHLLLSCLLLSLILSWSYAMPVPQSDVASGPDDVRWRMVAGMDTALHYAIRLVSYGSSTVEIQLLE